MRGEREESETGRNGECGTEHGGEGGTCAARLTVDRVKRGLERNRMRAQQGDRSFS